MRKKIVFLFLALLFIVFAAATSHGGQASLCWDPPTTNADGTPLTDLGGYREYHGTSSGNYSQNTDIQLGACVPCGGSHPSCEGCANACTYMVTGLTDGVTYYFVLTAYDTSMNESGYSNEVSKTISSGTTQYTLTASKSGTGTGTVTSSPSGINCGSACSYSYDSGTIVTVTASPAGGSSFTGWSGGTCSGTGTCSFTLNANTGVTAAFALDLTNRFFSAQASPSTNQFINGAPLTLPLSLPANVTGTPLAGKVTSNASSTPVIFANNGNWYVYNNGTMEPWLTGWGNGSQKQFLADVDGDGLADAVVYFDVAGYRGNWYVALNKIDHFQTNLTPWLTSWGNGSQNQFLADVNGDGKADAIVYFDVAGYRGNWYVATSSGSGFQGNLTPWLAGWGNGSKNQFLADVNGDGKADAVVFFDTIGYLGNWYIALNTGSSFQGNITPWLTNWGIGSQNQFLVDINGDGKADAVVYFKQ